MKIDRLGLIRERYSLKPISLIEVGKEIITDSPTVQIVAGQFESVTTAVKVVGYGLFGLAAIRSFIK